MDYLLHPFLSQRDRTSWSSEAKSKMAGKVGLGALHTMDYENSVPRRNNMHGEAMVMRLQGYGSIPINTIFSGMNIHLPAILMFTRGTRFWHTAKCIYFRVLYPYAYLLQVHIYIYIWIWLVVWNMNFIFPYIGNNHPNWRTHIFQRGRYTTSQIWFGFAYVSKFWLMAWTSESSLNFSWRVLLFASEVKNWEHYFFHHRRLFSVQLGGASHSVGYNLHIAGVYLIHSRYIYIITYNIWYITHTHIYIYIYIHCIYIYI